MSATIDQYVYLNVTKKYNGAVRVSYSQTENVAYTKDVGHPLVRAALTLANIRSGIEVVSVADVPAGTGLGSSSAFAVGLLHALYAHQGEFASADRLAHDACTVEIVMAHAPIGKQDQYAAAFGGLRCYQFYPDGSVSAEPLAMPADALSAFASRLLLVDTGLRREANGILADQNAAMLDSRARADVRSLANLARSLRDALLVGQIEDVGPIMDAAWRLKRGLTNGISERRIDAWYEQAQRAGATGGKLLGAGGGGFLLFDAPKEKHADIRHALGLRVLPFRFVPHGTQVIYAD